MSLPKVILFIGKPLSGKGTQAKLLAERKGYTIVKVSNIIRQKFEKLPESPELQKARESYVNGDIIDGKVVGPWVRERIRELHQAGESFILDGSPRTLIEAKELLEELHDLYASGEFIAIYLRISDQEAYARAAGRSRKVLDDPEILKERLKEYQEKTVPALEYLQSRGLLVEASGEKEIEEIYNDILGQIQKRD